MPYRDTGLERQQRLRGRRRIAILGLALLTATLIALPWTAPYVGLAALPLLILGLWGRSSQIQDQDAEKAREPSLWDDGFGLS